MLHLAKSFRFSTVKKISQLKEKFSPICDQKSDILFFDSFLFKKSSKSVKQSINSNKLFIDWMSSYHSFPHSLESHERNDFLIFRKSFVPDTLNCQISEVLMKLTISFLWPRNREINTIWCCLGNMIQSIIVH